MLSLFRSTVPLLVLGITLAANSLLAQGTPHRAARESQNPAPLIAVHVSGSQRYSEADIAAATGLKTGATVRPQVFKDAADVLVASGAFEEVRYRYEPAGNGYAVTFELVDGADFVPVSYDNFVWFTNQQLTETVHDRFPLFKGEVSTTDAMQEKVTEVLQSILADRGIAGTVRFVQESPPGQHGVEGKIDRGVFTIDGLNVAVREVNFPGTASADLPDLQKSAETLLKAPYQRSVVAAFAETDLRTFYAKRGYLKATFTAPELKLLKDDPSAPEVSVSIPVQPGQQYRVDKIRWWGAKALKPDDLQKLVSIKPGEVADAVTIASDLEKVRSAYDRRGYLRCSVAAHPSFDESDSTVSYEFAVHEGDVYRLHEIGIEGAGLSKDTVARLREAWQMREGEPYNSDYEREYVNAVRKLLAPNVTVEFNRDISEENKTVDVDLNFVAHADKVIRDNPQ